MAVRVRDGAVVPANYQAARLKIVWFLKQVRDPDQTWDGLLEMLREMGETGRLGAVGASTWRPVARASHGILNPDSPVGSWYDSEAVFTRSLLEIAVVNACKYGGGSSSAWQELESCFKADETAVRDQIESLHPDVIVIGGISWMIGEWPCGPAQKRPVETPFDSVRDAAGRIWVHAHHPSYPTGKGRYAERVIRSLIEPRELGRS